VIFVYRQETASDREIVRPRGHRADRTYRVRFRIANGATPPPDARYSNRAYWSSFPGNFSPRLSTSNRRVREVGRDRSAKTLGSGAVATGRRLSARRRAVGTTGVRAGSRLLLHAHSPEQYQSDRAADQPAGRVRRAGGRNDPRERPPHLPWRAPDTPWKSATRVIPAPGRCFPAGSATTLSAVSSRIKAAGNLCPRPAQTRPGNRGSGPESARGPVSGSATCRRIRVDGANPRSA